MENLQDLLLEHVVPDQTGEIGKIRYSFTQMKIVHVHWPKVSSVDGLFVAANGALRLQGKYELHRPGVILQMTKINVKLLNETFDFYVTDMALRRHLRHRYDFTETSTSPIELNGECPNTNALGYTKCGDFVFDLSSICVSIRDSTAVASPPPVAHGRHRHHDRNRNANDVTCTVGHIKVKFHGGAAMICQFLTSMYIKMYRRHLEGQISEVIKESIKDDQQILLSALTVMAAMNGSQAADSDTQPPSVPPSPHLTTPGNQGNPDCATGEGGGRIQRFIDSFKHKQHT